MAVADLLWALLHELDDPEGLERPANFNEHEATGRFVSLRAALERTFDCDCTADVWPSVQDASHFGRLVVPAASTATGDDLVVVISNFWPLAMYALENPGVHDQDEFDLLLDPRDKARATDALAGCGYVIVPEEMLQRRYDGSNQLLAGRSWWDRYFDYL